MRRAVVDQPGLKIIVLGLVISIFLGLALRSQITPHKINERLKQIVQDFEQKNKNKKVSIDFTEARLLLSDWGFPFPHLYIKNIKISSTAPECADNQIYIESLDIPFSWLNLIEAKDQIDTLRAGLVELRLDNPGTCLAESKPESEGASHRLKAGRSTASEAEPGKPFLPTRALNLYIDKLKIIDKHNYNLPVLLQTVGAKIIFEKNKISSLDVKSQLNLFRDLESSLYKFKSDFNLNYELKGESQVEASATVHGRLIDKPFEFNFAYNPESDKINITHSIKDLSVKALLSLMNNEKYRMQNQLEGVTGLSLSGQGHGEYDLKQKSLAFYKMTDMVLSSGESSISVDEIHLASLKPLKFEPFKIAMHQFDLEKIKGISAFASIQKSINDFGRITGVVLVNSESNIVAEGQLQDLQFIFSNRGQRAYQKIDEVFYKYTAQGLTLERISMEGLPTQGEIKVQLGKQPLQVHGEISNIKLNESVYGIFSFHQNKPTLIDLSLHVENNRLKSKLRFDQLTSSVIELKQLEVSYETGIGSAEGSTPDQIYDLNIKNLKIMRSETVDESFYTVLEQLDKTPGFALAEIPPTDFYFDMIKTHYIKKPSDEFAINMSANYFSKVKNEKNNVRLQSEFKNPNEALFSVDVFDHGRSALKFQVEADLSQYVFQIKK